MSRETRSRHRAELSLVTSGYLAMVAAEFLAMTHITLALTERGHSAFSVGLVVSLFWLGIVLATLVAHHLAARLGYGLIATGGGALEAAILMSMGWFDLYVHWAAGMLGLGFIGGLIWVCCEAWVAELAPEGKRGLCIGLFETAVGLGMMIGTAMLVLLLEWRVAPLPCAAVVMLLGTALVAPVQHLTDQTSMFPNVGSSIRLARTGASKPALRAYLLPLALLGGLGGMMENGTTAILPSLAVRVDFSVTAAALLGTIIGAGSALLQTPIGMLCDRMGTLRSLHAAWLILLATNLVLLLLVEQDTAVLWPVGFVLGGIGGAVYTLVVIELGNAVQGADLVRGMAVLVTAYSLGTMVGPALGGFAFDLGGMRLGALGLIALSVLGVAITWMARAHLHTRKSTDTLEPLGPTEG